MTDETNVVILDLFRPARGVAAPRRNLMAALDALDQETADSMRAWAARDREIAAVLELDMPKLARAYDLLADAREAVADALDC